MLLRPPPTLGKDVQQDSANARRVEPSVDDRPDSSVQKLAPNSSSRGVGVLYLGVHLGAVLVRGSRAVLTAVFEQVHAAGGGGVGAAGACRAGQVTGGILRAPGHTMQAAPAEHGRGWRHYGITQASPGGRGRQDTAAVVARSTGVTASPHTAA